MRLDLLLVEIVKYTDIKDDEIKYVVETIEEYFNKFKSK